MIFKSACSFCKFFLINHFRTLQFYFMPNEFEVSFSREAMETLMVGGVTEIVGSGKVLYDQKSKISTFEISAKGVETLLNAPSIIKGCLKPC